MSTAPPTRHTNPYPGLRPFREDEEHLFFGREHQVDAMVDKLAATRFLAVVGSSGSGKSSLVNCGLRPALRQGLMAKAGTAWRIAQFRPGGDPIGAMARALAETGVLFAEQPAGGLSLSEMIETALRMSRVGLADTYEQAGLDEHVNLLLVVDQFEELFRYRRSAAAGEQGFGADAVAFVNLLLEASQSTDFPIYVVLTMRSDFLGDCTHFLGLAEAINTGQYLVPRMTRIERRAAITGPAAVAGAEVSPVLLTRLVNDVGDNPDQLSILQHTLNRTWAYWEQGDRRGPLDLAHHDAIGTMARALDKHAEKAYGELATERQRKICERVFKGLTDKATDPRGIRRPTTLGLLCDLAEAAPADVTAVLDVFRKPSRSFLMPPAGESLDATSIIDISHESLMRVWKRLGAWADEEAASARTYSRLAETAGRYEAGQAGLLVDPDLRAALAWRDAEKPTAAWAGRYTDESDPDGWFESMQEFLRRSEKQAVDAVEAERRAADERERLARRQLRRTQGAALALLMLALLSVAGAYAAWAARTSARTQASAADDARRNADAERQKADDERQKADDAREQAESAEREAQDLAVQADTERRRAESAGRAAEAQRIQGESRSAVVYSVQSAAEDRELSLRLAIRAARTTLNFDGTVLPIASATLYDAARAYRLPLVKIEDAHAGVVARVVFHPDGTEFATASWDGLVKRWDARTFKVLAEIRHAATDDLRGRRVYDVEYSPDGSKLVTAGRDGTAKVWETKTGKPLVTIDNVGGGFVARAMFVQDEARVVTGDEKGQLKIWNASDGSFVATLGQHSGIVTDVGRLDGTKLVSVSYDATVRQWDLSQTVPAAPSAEGLLFKVTNQLRSVSIGSGGLLAAGGEGSQVTVWDRNKTERQAFVIRHGRSDDFINEVRFNKDGTLLATGSEGGEAYVWDVSGETPLQVAAFFDAAAIRQRRLDIATSFRREQIASREVRALTFSPDDSQLVTFSSSFLNLDDNRSSDLVVWPLREDVPGIELQLGPPSTQTIMRNNSVGLHDRGSRAVRFTPLSGSASTWTWEWEESAKSELGLNVNEGGDVLGAWLTNAETRLKLLKRDTTQAVPLPDVNVGRYRQAVVSDKGNAVAVAGNNAIAVHTPGGWRIEKNTGRELQVRDDGVVAWISDRGEPRVWKAGSQGSQPLRRRGSAQSLDGVKAICWRPNSRMLVTLDYQGEIVFWNADDLTEIRTPVSIPRTPDSAMQLSASGDLLGFVGESQASVYDLRERPASSRTFDCPSCRGIAFSPDGQLVALQLADGLIVADRITGQTLRRYAEGRPFDRSLPGQRQQFPRFLDNRRLAGYFERPSKRTELLVVDVSVGALVKHAESKTNRPFTDDECRRFQIQCAAPVPVPAAPRRP